MFATIAPALLGLALLLNEGLLHRSSPNPTLIGTGMTLLTGSLMIRATNGG